MKRKSWGQSTADRKVESMDQSCRKHCSRKAEEMRSLTVISSTLYQSVMCTRQCAASAAHELSHDVPSMHQAWMDPHSHTETCFWGQRKLGARMGLIGCYWGVYVQDWKEEMHSDRSKHWVCRTKGKEDMAGLKITSEGCSEVDATRLKTLSISRLWRAHSWYFLWYDGERHSCICKKSDYKISPPDMISLSLVKLQVHCKKNLQDQWRNSRASLSIMRGPYDEIFSFLSSCSRHEK